MRQPPAKNVTLMPGKSNEQEIVLETNRGHDDACSLQVEPVVLEKNGIVDRLNRMVAGLAVLEEMLSFPDPVGQLRAFYDSLNDDGRLVNLKSLALAQRDELLNDVDAANQLHAFRVFLDADERLANLKCLAAEQRQGLDIFDVLQIHHLEYVHSNFLAWLLDPRQSHGIESHFLRNFLSRTVEAAQQQVVCTMSPDRIHSTDWSETEVLREWRYIDILILNRKEGFVCAIENKIWAEEGFGEDGKSQLAWYRETLESVFPDFDRHLVFLSPRGIDSKSETERKFWVPEDYVAIQHLIVETIRENSDRASPEVQWFLAQYEATLRRNIVTESSEVGELARQIYLEHREVIELISRHKPDYSAEIRQILKEAISQQDGWLIDTESGSYVRFRSSRWDRFESMRTGTGWAASPALMLFEFYCPTNPTGTGGAALTLSPGTDEAVRRQLYETARQNPRLFKPRHSSLQDGHTMLDEYRWNLLEESDLGARWADGTARAKLMEWVKRYAEEEFPGIDDAIVQCLESFENVESDQAS